MNSTTTTFRQLLDDKETVFGVFSKTNDPLMIEAIGRAGFDFVILDCEHGPNSHRDVLNLINASIAGNIFPIIRVEKNDSIAIQKIMDLGISGVQVPQVTSKQDANDVRHSTHFYPKGMRGICRYVRPAEFSLKSPLIYFSEQNEIVKIIQIEGKEGIDAIEGILEVPDLDIIFIGPNDLSQSLGVPGDVNNPIVLSAISTIVSRCKLNHKYTGIFVDNLETAKKYKAMGVKYIAYSVDVGIFARTCLDIVNKLSDDTL